MLSNKISLFADSEINTKDKLIDLLRDFAKTTQLSPAELRVKLKLLINFEESDIAYSLLQDLITKEFYCRLSKVMPTGEKIKDLQTLEKRIITLEELLCELFGIRGLLSHSLIMCVCTIRFNNTSTWSLSSGLIAFCTLKILLEQFRDNELVQASIRGLNTYFVDINEQLPMITYDDARQPCLISQSLEKWIHDALSHFKEVALLSELADDEVLKMVNEAALHKLSQLGFNDISHELKLN